MTESSFGRTSDLEPVEPRVITLGEKFQPLIPPLKRWYGYSPHLSMNPGWASEWILRTGFMPDLPIAAIVQTPEPRERMGKFYLEADKNRLGELGMLEMSPVGPRQLSSLPMPPAVLGAERWAGYYIFDEKTLRAFAQLRLQIVIPEGEYTSASSIYEEKHTKIKYATGLKFDSFVKTGLKFPQYEIILNSKDNDSLNAVIACFVTK